MKSQKQSLELFRKYFETDFFYDGCFIMDKNNQMILMPEDGNKVTQEEIDLACKAIVNILNEDKTVEYKFDAPIYRNKEYIYNSNNELIFIIRGWGYLTGRGGLNLHEEKAIKIQNSFGDYIVTEINRRYGKFED